MFLRCVLDRRCAWAGVAAVKSTAPTSQPPHLFDFTPQVRRCESCRVRRRGDHLRDPDGRRRRRDHLNQGRLDGHKHASRRRRRLRSRATQGSACERGPHRGGHLPQPVLHPVLHRVLHGWPTGVLYPVQRHQQRVNRAPFHAAVGRNVEVAHLFTASEGGRDDDPVSPTRACALCSMGRLSPRCEWGWQRLHSGVPTSTSEAT